MQLTDTHIKAVKPLVKAKKYFDGGGLFLYVPPNGSKLWRMAYRFEKRAKLLSFGEYPTISLKEARERREDAKKLLAKGIDPSAHGKAIKAERIAATQNSFHNLALEWYDSKTFEFSAKHRGTIMFRLEKYLFPSLGKVPITKVDAQKIQDQRQFADESIQKHAVIEGLPVKQQSPEIAEDFLQTRFPDMDKDVYVPADAVLELSQGNIDLITPLELDIVQLQEAAELGQDVPVKLTKAHATLDQARFEQFASIMKAGAESLNAVDVAQYDQRVQEDAARIEQDVLEQQALNDAFEVEIKRFEDGLRERINAIPRLAREAEMSGGIENYVKANSEIFRRGVTMLGERNTGMFTAADFARKPSIGERTTPYAPTRSEFDGVDGQGMAWDGGVSSKFNQASTLAPETNITDFAARIKGKTKGKVEHFEVSPARGFLTGLNVRLQEDETRHILNEHPDVTSEDFANLPMVLRNLSQRKVGYHNEPHALFAGNVMVGYATVDNTTYGIIFEVAKKNTFVRTYFKGDKEKIKKWVEKRTNKERAVEVLAALQLTQAPQSGDVSLNQPSVNNIPTQNANGNLENLALETEINEVQAWNDANADIMSVDSYKGVDVYLESLRKKIEQEYKTELKAIYEGLKDDRAKQEAYLEDQGKNIL